MEIFVDENGKPSVHAVGNALIRIRDVFFPMIKDKITTITLPTIEFDSKKYFFRISNVKIGLKDLIPEHLKVESDFNVDIDFMNMKRHGEFNVRVKLDPFNAEVEKLNFFIKKKTGFKYKDYGSLNIYLRESSILMEFNVKLNEDKVDNILLTKVIANLYGLKVKVREAKHDVLDKLAIAIFLPTLRANLENIINTTLYDNINNGICDRINRSLKGMYEKKKIHTELKAKKKIEYDIDREVESLSPKLKTEKKHKKVVVEKELKEDDLRKKRKGGNREHEEKVHVDVVVPKVEKQIKSEKHIGEKHVNEKLVSEKHHVGEKPVSEKHHVDEKNHVGEKHFHAHIHAGDKHAKLEIKHTKGDKHLKEDKHPKLEVHTKVEKYSKNDKHPTGEIHKKEKNIEIGKLDKKHKETDAGNLHTKKEKVYKTDS
jgi:hypothetical protein